MMNWTRQIDRTGHAFWTMGRFKVASKGVTCCLTHPDLKTLWYPNPDMAMSVARYLVRGGLKV